MTYNFQGGQHLASQDQNICIRWVSALLDEMTGIQDKFAFVLPGERGTTAGCNPVERKVAFYCPERHALMYSVLSCRICWMAVMDADFSVSEMSGSMKGVVTVSSHLPEHHVSDLIFNPLLLWMQWRKKMPMFVL